MIPFRLSLLTCFLFLTTTASVFAQGVEGYYQFPTVYQDQLIFSAEGDLWKVSLAGGVAQRLTTHPEEERYPQISPDGKTVLFSASYEGPTELYSMPIEGGLPTRWTYESDQSVATAWTPSGEMVYATRAYNTKPEYRLVSIDPETKTKTFLPFDQASEASFDASGKTIYFVTPGYHGNVTKRYQGGTARQIWKFTEGTKEAIKLTTDHAGESHHPMWHDGRVYFLTDRDGIMNIWSMDESGGDLKQHTRHEIFDVRYAKTSDGVIVYQKGADIWKYDIATDASSKIPIRLATDLDQLREKWEENPSRYITSVHPDAKGENIVITARGRVFVAPAKQGRMVSFTQQAEVRFRDATFSADGKEIIALSDESGEFEFVRMPANGIGSPRAISSDGSLLRYRGIPSPDGTWIAYSDLESNLYLLDIASGVSKKISTNQEGIGGFSWSPDSKWLAFVQTAFNSMTQIRVAHVDGNQQFDLTTDRANSFSPSWSPDGKFIYFLSDRNFVSLVGSPWGTRQPEPYFDASEKIYHVALQKGTRSPFRPDDELYENFKQSEKKDQEEDKDQKGSVEVQVDIAGIQTRIEEVPVKPGNYFGLAVNDKALYLMSSETGVGAKRHLSFVKIDHEKPEVKQMVSEVSSFELTGDGKKLLIRKGSTYFLTKAGTSPISKLQDDKIDLSGWKFAIQPREDWKQIFTDAWRMERDYFYDKNMHGVDWRAMHDRYLPLVDRVTTRNELSDLIGRFVGELSALHTSVRGGDIRSDETSISVANLGGVFLRDEAAGGFRIAKIYRADPDYPDEKSPLDDPYLDIREGDIITQVNGVRALSAIDMGALIRNQVGKQVRLTLKREEAERDVIVVPIGNTYGLRYRDWEYQTRLYVDEAGEDEIGYVHLRAMGSQDINQFYREFYPIFNRKGLIIDVRYNRGGNIDSFILEKLLRKAWMYWKGRAGEPYWNMPYAFRGHMVILVNENTYSDGEAFADGFKKLGLGTAIGTRTWGGEIWLNSANRLSDGGLARAPMFGVYGEGEWLIEGHGFVPDIEVVNMPHATFNGEDAQLDAAINHLKELIEADPREVPQPPAYPDKSFKNNRP